MMKALRISMMAVGGIVLSLAIMVGVSVVFFGEDTARYPITTFEATGKRVVVYAPGSGERTYVTTSNVNEGQVIVRNRRIALQRDGSVLVDGLKLDLVGFTLLEVYVHPNEKVETRVVMATS